MDKKARLVVYNNGVENVCRKSTLKDLAVFMQSGENHLFKGRLQLHKVNSSINILVKGSKVGEIPVSGFLSYLQQFEAPPKSSPVGRILALFNFWYSNNLSSRLSLFSSSQCAINFLAAELFFITSIYF